MVSTEYDARECPELRLTIQPTIELSPTTKHGVVPTDYYRYSSDRLWELIMECQGSRLVKCRQRAYALSLSKIAAVVYLLSRRAAMFKLKR